MKIKFKNADLVLHVGLEKDAGTFTLMKIKNGGK